MSNYKTYPNVSTWTTYPSRISNTPEKETDKKVELHEDRLRIDMGLPNSMLRDVLEQTKREVVEDLKKQINKCIFEDRYSYYGSQKDKLQEWVKDMIKEEVLAASKDLIIEKAAKELASSMSCRKVDREQFMEQLEESLEETE